MNLDKTQWSGEGIFTQALVDACQTLEDIIFLRVEDAPASRADVEFNFITNELYVQFRERSRAVQAKVFGLFPVTRTVTEPTMTVAGLEQAFCGIDEIGPPDYADEGMLQYLRTERIVPPYQTRGYKLVELVRGYEVGSPSRRQDDDG